MGNLTVPDYESLDYESLPGREATLLDKTQTGRVKHNEWESLETGDPTPGTVPRRAEAAESAVIMANDLFVQPESASQTAADPAAGHELDAFLGRAFEDKPIWADLYENIHDIFFPPKLPPLELTSTPIPVPDRMAVKPNPWAIGISTGFNVSVLAFLLYLGVAHVVKGMLAPQVTVTPVEISEYKAPRAPDAPGGGGGQHDQVEAIKGKLPDRATPKFDVPKLIQPPVPTIDVQKDLVIPDNPTLPNIGLSKSTNVTLASGGRGSGMGLGDGNGNGVGPGSGWNYGGGLERVGGQVSAPIALFQPEAEFSDEARRAKYQGVCIVTLIVDAQGNPRNPRVVQPLGMGLDEKAIEAVLKYKFKPAMKNGKPVAVPVNIEVNFRLY